jgi:hypothetical protein
MASRSVGRMLLVVLMGPFLACNLFTVAAAQGTQQYPYRVADVVRTGAVSNNFYDFFKGIGLTSARFGIFYGWGDIHVDDHVALGQNSVLLYQDFSSFDHHRKTDLKDAYFSGVLGIGAPEMEFLSFGVETNLGSITRFKQFTDPENFGAPYGAAVVIVGLYNNQAGFIPLNNKNRYWAFDLCGRLPIFSAFDLLAGYKWLQIKSNIDPYSAGNPPDSFPVLPGLGGWSSNWADLYLTSGIAFDMHQKIMWHGPFIGLRMSNIIGYGFEWFFDTRLYPRLFGKYTFSWNAAYLDPNLNFTPGIWGSQFTNMTDNNRWGVDVDFRCRSLWKNLVTIELEARYSYAWMSGSCLEYQTEGNIEGFGPGFAQNTPETLSIRQQLLIVGGSLEIGF